MNAIADEAEDDARMRNASQFLSSCRADEIEARKNLARMVNQTAFARARYEKVFRECEKRAYDRRKAGLIPVTTEGGA